jgi:hypothetical protein
MQLEKNNQFINSVKSYVKDFDDTSYRILASKDFKNWPKPSEETWRLSKLKNLSKKKPSTEGLFILCFYIITTEQVLRLLLK